MVARKVILAVAIATVAFVQVSSSLYLTYYVFSFCVPFAFHVRIFRPIDLKQKQKRKEFKRNNCNEISVILFKC